MVTQIPYRRYPDSAGGYIDSVALKVQFSLPKPDSRRTKGVECIIDSGASRCLFHADIVAFLGLDLRSGTLQITNGIGGPEEIWLHDIWLFVPGGPLQITAGFKEDLPVGGLLGMSGFFEHFHIVFDPAIRACTLERIFRA